MPKLFLFQTMRIPFHRVVFHMQEYANEVKGKPIAARWKYLDAEVWESKNTEDTESDRYVNEREEVPKWTVSTKSSEVEEFIFIIASFPPFDTNFRFQMMQDNSTYKTSQNKTILCVCTFSNTRRKTIGYLDDKVKNTFLFYCKCLDSMDTKKIFVWLIEKYYWIIADE